MGTERDPDRARTVGESGDAEPGLRESEAKYRALFESIEEAFLHPAG